ncbi:MAG: hypothetical protein NZ958_01365 [Bacteroidia bacterium]|nr:hypothetical protein [Bacteroidia bacterium]MDW8089313.1 hypothetical protein [Bacteroidia bacterium]
MLRLLVQVVLWGGWGGHTSVNDLTPKEEVWHRFYGIGRLGVSFLGYRRLQPQFFWEGGAFISQDRLQARWRRTQWNSLGVGLRWRILRRAVSPLLEGHIFRFTATVRTLEGRVPLEGPSSVGVMGLGWAAGVSWRCLEWAELSLLYLRRLPATDGLESYPGPVRDRLEGFVGHLGLFLPQPRPSAQSRF